MYPAMSISARTPDGADPAAYAWMRELDRTGWAWEWLRRDPAYRGVLVPGSPRRERAIVRSSAQADPSRGLLFRRGSCALRA